jgi:hypothetical protein
MPAAGSTCSGKMIPSKLLFLEKYFFFSIFLLGDTLAKKSTVGTGIKSGSMKCQNVFQRTGNGKFDISDMPAAGSTCSEKKISFARLGCINYLWTKLQ